MTYTAGDGFRDQAAGELRRRACERLQNAAVWTYALDRIFINLNWAPTWSLYQTLNHWFCGQPLEGWEPPVGWRGGQCPVFYEVYVEWYLERLDGVPDPANFRNARVTVLGPIERIGFFQEPDPNGVFSGYVALVEGQPQQSLPDGTVRFAGVDPGFFKKPFFTRIDTIRLDGGSDSCGPTPPPAPRPPEVDFDMPITWVGPNGNDITVNANVTIGRIYLDADANLNFPFSVNIPVDVDVNTTIPFDFTMNFNFGTGDWVFRPSGPGDSPVGRPPGSPRPPQPPPSPPRDDPPPPSQDPGTDPPPVDPQEGERRMVAALVRAVELQSNKRPTQIFQEEAPDIYAPNLGYACFQIRLADGQVAWTQDVPIKNSNQLVICPWEGGAVRVVVNPAVGVELSATPLYAESEDFLDLFGRRL